MIQRSRLVILGVVVIGVALWGLRPRANPQLDDGPATTAIHNPIDCAHVRAGGGPYPCGDKTCTRPLGWYVDGQLLTRDDLRVCRQTLVQLQSAGQGSGLALE